MPTQPFNSLNVVTYVNWLVDDLRHNSYLPVTHDLGLDLRVPAGIPVSEYVAGLAFWAPMRNAARVVATTGQNPFTTPGPYWLEQLPVGITGRKVQVLTLGELKSDASFLRRPAHVKPADIKISTFPAQVFSNHSEFCGAVRTVPGIPDSTLMQVSELMDYRQEVRCFITDGVVTAASVYLHNSKTWDAWELDFDAPSASAGQEFAQAVVPDLPGPRGYVLDVGMDEAGNWSVIEANPAWSSNPYHSTPDGVVVSVCAAQHPDNDVERWGWVPPEFFTPLLRRPLPVVEVP